MSADRNTPDHERIRRPRRQCWGEFACLLLLIFAYAGDLPPMVNEAHYLVKAKNFWDPDWCGRDLFASSGKAHTTYYLMFGWLTKFFSLTTTAWIARFVGWSMIAVGLQRVCHTLIRMPFAACGVLVIWAAGIEYGNLAGEWVFGGTEAKIPAYGLAMLGLAAMLRGRWSSAWIWFGAAAAFHILVGGWCVVAGMFAWLMTEAFSKHERSAWRRFLSPGLFIGGGLSLFGLIPAIALTMGVSADQAITSARTYVFFRIAHHLLPSTFPAVWFVRHFVLIVAATVTAWMLRLAATIDADGTNDADGTMGDRSAWQRLVLFVGGTVLIAGVGLVIGFAPGLDSDWVARLLRYYWFRLTDVMVPLLLALASVRLIAAWIDGRGDASTVRRPGTLIGVVVFGVTLMMFVSSTIERTRLGVPPSASNRLLGYDKDVPIAVQRAVYQDWLKVCDFIRNSTPTSEVFLTPRHQQTFKWYAQRAEVVNFKDVPQDAASLVQWSRRFGDVFPRRLGMMRVTIQYAKLREYRRDYGVRYLLADRRICGQNLPLVRLYPTAPEENSTYAVYELPPPLDGNE